VPREEWKNCQHLEGVADLFGSHVKYKAHIKVVPGPQKSEVLDDIHIELDARSVTTLRARAYLSDEARAANFCKSIAEGDVLSRYLMQGLKPQPPE
jgi:lipase chaperone LimK